MTRRERIEKVVAQLENPQNLIRMVSGSVASAIHFETDGDRLATIDTLRSAANCPEDD